MSQSLRVAGFELIISGRFWVIAKAQQNGIKAIQDLPTQKWIEYSTRYSCEPF